MSATPKERICGNCISFRKSDCGGKSTWCNNLKAGLGAPMPTGATSTCKHFSPSDPAQEPQAVAPLREAPESDCRCDYCKEHGFQYPNLCEDCRAQVVGNPAPSEPHAVAGEDVAALMAQLREKSNWRSDIHSDLHRKSADVIGALMKERRTRPVSLDREAILNAGYEYLEDDGSVRIRIDAVLALIEGRA